MYCFSSILRVILAQGPCTSISVLGSLLNIYRCILSQWQMHLVTMTIFVSWSRKLYIVSLLESVFLMFERENYILCLYLKALFRCSSLYFKAFVFINVQAEAWTKRRTIFSVIFKRWKNGYSFSFSEPKMHCFSQISSLHRDHEQSSRCPKAFVWCSGQNA